MSIYDIVLNYSNNMNEEKKFCIISIDGRFNKFSLNFSKLNNCFSFSINSHEKFSENVLKEKTKEFPNIIIVSALAGESSNKTLLNLLEILKDKNCLVVASTPFDFEGKKRKKIADEILDILDDKKVNKIVFYSRNFFRKWKEEDLSTFKDIYSFVNLQIVQTINEILGC